MPKPEPTKSQVTTEVFTALASRAYLSVSAVRALAAAGKDDLKKDLGIPPLAMGGVVLDLSYIAKKYPNGKRVPKSAVSKAKTATKCAELTFKRAKGETS